MVVKYLRDQRHAGTVAEIAASKFPYPDEKYPDLETIVNVPRGGMSIGQVDGKEFFPDIAVVRRPGAWLKMMAQVETADTVNDDTAVARWLPCSRAGDLLIYVPYGCVAETKRLCKKHGVKAAGIRTWRFRPVWGLEVADAWP